MAKTRSHLRSAPLKFGSLFSGIGGFDLGLERSSMTCEWQVEKDAKCLELLAAKFPNTKRFDDVCNVCNVGSANLAPVDVICGGFPCQDVSLAGRRAGLAGGRSGLWFEFARIIAAQMPRVVLIENVPGLLSSNKGRDMGTILWTLGQLGYGWAYRVIDAQYLRVAQRRRRVFIVGCFGDMRRAAEILFESESLPWDPPPSREAGEEVAACVRGGTESGSNESGNKVAVTHTHTHTHISRNDTGIGSLSDQSRRSL